MGGVVWRTLALCRMVVCAGSARGAPHRVGAVARALALCHWANACVCRGWSGPTCMFCPRVCSDYVIFCLVCAARVFLDGA